METDDQQVEIRDNPEERRFEAHLEGTLAGYSEYILAPGRVIFTHTVVDPAYEGRGIGSSLVRFELDEMRERGLKVAPKCPFVRAYIKRHPEYRDLLPEGAVL